MVLIMIIYTFHGQGCQQVVACKSVSVTQGPYIAPDVTTLILG